LLFVHPAREYPGTQHFDSLAFRQPGNRHRHAQPPIAETGQLDRLADTAHHPARDPCSAQLGFPHRGITRSEDRVELVLHGLRISTSAIRITEARIREPVLSPEDAREQLELPLL